MKPEDARSLAAQHGAKFKSYEDGYKVEFPTSANFDRFCEALLLAQMREHVEFLESMENDN